MKQTKETLTAYIQTYEGSQRKLIETLNKKLTGFSTYHKSTHAREAFRQIDKTVTKELMELCRKKHPTWNDTKIKKKYFYIDDKDRYIYTLEGHLNIQVLRLEDVVFAKHQKVGTKFNPYLDKEYLRKREEQREIRNVTGRYKQIWNKQAGICAICNKPILADQYRDVQKKNESKGNQSDNLVYVHSKCKESMEMEFITLDTVGTSKPHNVTAEQVVNDKIEQGNLPENARYELNQFLEYLKGKYGLK